MNKPLLGHLDIAELSALRQSLEHSLESTRILLKLRTGLEAGNSLIIASIVEREQELLSHFAVVLGVSSHLIDSVLSSVTTGLGTNTINPSGSH